MYMCVDTCSTYIAAASVPRQGRKIGKVQMAQPLREGKKVMLIWLLRGPVVVDARTSAGWWRYVTMMVRVDETV